MAPITLEDLGLSGIGEREAHDVVHGRGFVEIGRGNHAVVYAHPDLPDLAIRIGRRLDGWVAYGILSLESGVARSPHVPLVHQISALRGEGYVASTERLHGPRSREQEFLVASVSRLAARPFDPATPDVASFPHLRRFMRETLDSLDAATHAAFVRLEGRDLGFHSRSHLDPGEGNFLFREDGTLVVNDPCGDVLPSSFAAILDEVSGGIRPPARSVHP